MQRQEFKYLLPVSCAGELRRKIGPFVTRDSHATGRPYNEYTVRSLYLDTVNLDFYHDKLEGVHDRMKLRVRTYNTYAPEIPAWLELKKKSGRTVNKLRTSLPFDEIAPLLMDGDIARHVPPGTGSNEQQSNARRFLFYLHSRMLRPVITTIYERDACFARMEHTVRITIDRDLRYQPVGTLDTLFEANGSAYSIPDHCVIEVKTPVGIPRWLGAILAHFEVRQEAVSKYVICLSHREALSHSRPTSPLWWSASLKGASSSLHAQRL